MSVSIAQSAEPCSRTKENEPEDETVGEAVKNIQPGNLVSSFQKREYTLFNLAVPASDVTYKRNRKETGRR
jgi:hypothetical protein